MFESRPRPQLKKSTRQNNPALKCQAYKFRLYPTKKQIGTLEWTLRCCKELYNAALQERRDAIECFWTAPLDALVVGSFLLEKP